MDDRLLQFNFYDSTGKNWVININRDCMGSEAILLDKVEHVIRSYKVVLTYYEKGKDMGFSKWHKRALANDRVSPIDMGFRKDGKGAYINLANHNYQPIKDIDLGLVYEMPIIENFLQNIYLSNELDEVARSLLGEGKLDGMSGEYFAELPLEKQVAYGMKDAELTYKLAGARNYAVLSVLEKIGQLFIGGEFADLVKMCSTGPTRWWSALFENKFNAIPSPTAIKRTGAKGELKGGHVEDINEIKEYRWVVVFDFRGQYPSIISRYNICFTTACCDCCKDDPSALVRTGLEEVDKNGWWFCRKKRGIVPQIVDALVAMRDDFKAKMKAANKAGNKELAQEYDVMQNACKLLANSLYGVFGETFFEFGDLRVANTITGYGRAKVIQMGKKIEQDYPGLRSIYHDTDSAFILGLEPTELEPALDENHATVMDIVTKISAPEGEEGGGLGLPLEYKKCYKKVMIKAPKNYMGLNAATGLIETVGLVGKKRNQCKLVRQAFEQEREYWKDDVSNDIVEDHIKQIVTKLDSGGQPLELLQEKVTIGHDPWTGYSLKAQHSSGCVLGKKYNRRIGESTPPYYLAKQEQEGDLAFTEDPTKIDYKKYRERLRTALEGILTVRGYKKERIDAILGLTKPPKPPKVKKEKKPRAPKRKKAKGKKPVSSSAEEDIKPVRMKRVWSMPSPRPFQIPAIAQLIKEECAGVPPEKVVDLFPYRATKDAFELLKSLPDSSISVFLLDPPYSQKQAKDLYNGHGKEYGIQIVSWESPKEYWTAFRKEIARVLEPSGKCITLAWNTQGTGKGLGFEITRILQVAHGGNRNDTVVTVDRKMGDFK
jgi:DNA polymerase elongation subunit (family B)